MISTLGRTMQGIMPAQSALDSALAVDWASTHLGLILTKAGQNDRVGGDSHQQPSTARPLSYTFNSLHTWHGSCIQSINTL